MLIRRKQRQHRSPQQHMGARVALDLSSLLPKQRQAGASAVVLAVPLIAMCDCTMCRCLILQVVRAQRLRRVPRTPQQMFGCPSLCQMKWASQPRGEQWACQFAQHGR